MQLPSRNKRGACCVGERLPEPQDVRGTSTVSRVAVVTGAASGIGLGVARRFAAEGDRVALLDRHAEGAESAAAELREQGFTAVAHEVDVADWSAVSRAFEHVRAELGPVAVLVTCAGIESFDAALEITPQMWGQLLAVNLTGTFACIQAALPDMIAARWGRIVTISSSSAQSGAPHMAHYAASKGGVIGLTKALARELASAGVTVRARREFDRAFGRGLSASVNGGRSLSQVVRRVGW